ncbi:hypothetical protein SCMU_34090 [Sinomonas cyclohexanicum]|uniref:Uncharacterized protein n=1 Tax=Sinomonas cyclohexanicum TaxID=322009 RepID=A0ABM7PZ38_SINCY|nr:hypothetical protein [Corynebacterium cyclohexanicum]BCT77567.1 hypothetical protein SCMU_34090 [Corynebacterium cyclohexanicum]
MSDFRTYTEEEKHSFVAPACDLCGQHRHIVWQQDGDKWIPRDKGCSNEACPQYGG